MTSYAVVGPRGIPLVTYREDPPAEEVARERRRAALTAHWLRYARQWRRGWHVTPVSNLASIERVGLLPYPIDREDMDVRGLGIFTWVRRPVGENLGGIALQRLMAHRAWRLALLSYLYRPADCHPWGSGVNTIFHNGSMGPVNDSRPWTFHADEEGHVLWRPVPPERIRIEAVFDVGALFGF